MLILGVVTTVAVAWGLACDRPRINSYDWHVYAPDAERYWVLWYTQWYGGPGWRMVTLEYRYEDIFATGTAPESIGLMQEADAEPPDVSSSRGRALEAFERNDVSPCVYIAEVSYGLPCYALWAGREERKPTPTQSLSAVTSEEWFGALRLKKSHQSQFFSASAGLDGALPCFVIFPGFLVNTLFYAAMWFGIFFGVATLRRFVRKKRGRCVKCGYDLRGQRSDVRDQKKDADQNSALTSDIRPLTSGIGCPECGWGRE